MKFRKLIHMALAAALAASGASALAQAKWKVASISQPGSVSVGFIDEMVDKINAGATGEIKIEHLFIGNEQEIVAQLVRGRLEMGSLSNNAAAGVIPEMALLSMPYLWKSAAERDFVTDQYAVPVMKRLFEAKGLVLVGVGDVGWNNVFCKKACLTPDSLKGAKVRVSPSAASKMFWGALDTNGVQLPVSELFPGLQSGLVDAADLPFLIYITTPAAQTAPHFVKTRHAHLGSTTVINKALWDKLTPAQKKLLNEARPSAEHVRKGIEEAEAPKMEDFKKKGGFVHELTAEQRAAWARLVEPQQARFLAETGLSKSELWAAVQKGKQEFALRASK